MVKKPKLKKGGKTFVEKLLGKTFEGPFIADDINYNIKKGRSVGLKEEYKLRKELADEDYKFVENKMLNEEDKNQKIADRDFKYNKLNQDNFNFKLKLFWNFLSTLASGIFNLISRFVDFLRKTTATIFLPMIKLFSGMMYGFFLILSKFFNAGQGAGVKVIILIIIIAICIGLGFYLFSPSSGGTSISNVTNKTNLDVFVQMKSPSFLGSFTSGINDLVPDKYKVQFTSFKNMINKAIGNDVVAKSIDNKPREDIKDVGRYNGITNVRIDDSSKIYSVLQPKMKTWEIKLNDYENADFNKLPEEVKIDILKCKNNSNFIKGDINDYEMEYKFEVKKVTNVTNNGEVKKYKYQLNADNTPINSDDNSINEIRINPISITDRDINRDKDKLMFSFEHGKFRYPDYPYKK